MDYMNKINKNHDKENFIIVNAMNFDNFFNRDEIVSQIMKDFDLTEYYQNIKNYNVSIKYRDALINNGFDPNFVYSITIDDIENSKRKNCIIADSFTKQVNEIVINNFMKYEKSLVKDLSIVDSEKKYLWSRHMTEYYKHFTGCGWDFIDYNYMEKFLNSRKS